MGRTRNLADLLDDNGDVKAGALDNAEAVTRSANAPSNPNEGDLWYDTTNKTMKHYDGANWLKMSNKFEATGGSVTTSGGYKIHTFTSSGTFQVTSGVQNVEYLVIGGGGGGGLAGPGGGGAGGYRCSVSGESSGGGASAESALTVTEGNYSITVGAGGATAPNTSTHGVNGSNSVFGSITSLGGGGGGSGDGIALPSSGGSGGGGSYFDNGASGTTGQGYRGGNSDRPSYSGGGGGAGAPGQDITSNTSGAGGAGVTSSITGSAITRAGGGGGYSSGAGGSGGGGAHGSSGQANTGGGGGGNAGGGNGGSGIVIIRYEI